MKWTTALQSEASAEAEQAVLAERKGCAEAICYWCFWERVGLPGAAYEVGKAQESQKYLYLHTLRYKDGGSGAVKCEAGAIWARG